MENNGYMNIHMVYNSCHGYPHYVVIYHLLDIQIWVIQIGRKKGELCLYTYYASLPEYSFKPKNIVHIHTMQTFPSTQLSLRTLFVPTIGYCGHCPQQCDDGLWGACDVH